MMRVGGKLLNRIKRMYINSLDCVRVKRGENECFRIENGVRQGHKPLVFHVYMDTVMKELK